MRERSFFGVAGICGGEGERRGGRGVAGGHEGYDGLEVFCRSKEEFIRRLQ